MFLHNDNIESKRLFCIMSVYSFRHHLRKVFCSRTLLLFAVQWTLQQSRSNSASGFKSRLKHIFVITFTVIPPNFLSLRRLWSPANSAIYSTSNDYC